MVAIICIAAALASCMNLTLPEVSVKDDAAASGLVPVYIGLGEVESAGRVIAPTANPDIAAYRLYYGPTGGTQAMLAEFSAITAATKANVLPGTYDFTLTALDDEGRSILEGACVNVAVSDSPVSLSFDLKILGSGDGFISITASWPATVPVTQVIPVFAGVPEAAMPVSGLQTLSYYKTAPKGGYLLYLSFRDASGLEIASIPEYVRVYPNMESKAHFALAQADFNSPPSVPATFTIASAGNTSDLANASVNLTWADSSLNESGFEIEYSDDSGSNWIVLSSVVSAASTAYSATVPRGVTRLFRVRAVNAFGPSSWVTAAGFNSPYVFSYSVNGGSAIAAAEVVPGALAVKPVNPAKYGSLFGGWYLDDSAFTDDWNFLTDAVSANVTVFAKWTKAIILEPNRGEGSAVTLEWAESTTAPLPANTFTRAGYTFVGWSKTPLGAVHYADGASYTMTTGDTLYARWLSADASPAADFTTAANGEGLTITRYNPTSGTNVSVVVPEMIGGKPVLSIGRVSTTGAFGSKTFVTSIRLPETLKTIDIYAFGYCTGLTSIVIPEGVTEIVNAGSNSSSFYNCTNLVSVTLPSTLTTLGNYAFAGCSKLETVSMTNASSSALAMVGNSAFYNCVKLLSITLPDSVAAIGSNAFGYCAILTTIQLPSSLKTIEGGAFTNCTALETITFPNGLQSIGSSSFNTCSKLGSVIIPGTVTSLETQAFSNCTALSQVEIRGNINTIGFGAFSDCVNLESVVISGLVKNLSSNSDYVQYGVFYNCKKLVSVDLGPAMESLGTGTFYGCTALTSITLPSSFKQLHTYVFGSCSKLKTVNIESNILTSLGNYVFQNCSQLRSISLPDSVTSIGVSVFQGCSNLVSAKLSSQITILNSNLFMDCISLESIIIPEGATSIQSNAFSNCPALVSVSLPSTLKSISNAAFQNCLSLESITVPNAVTTIGADAFLNCQNLRTAVIGNGVTSIGNNAFDGCRMLSSLTLGFDLATIGQYAFRNCRLDTMNIPPRVTSIAQYAFANCDGITTVTLPDSLTSLGVFAFSDCDSLSTLSFGTGLSTIPDSAFAYCPALSGVNFGNAVTTIGQSAFYGASSLVSVDMPAVVTIETKAFLQATKLESVRLGSAISSIKQLAFANCPKLASVEIKAIIPPTLASINAFAGNALSRTFFVRDLDDNSVLNAYRSAENWSDFNEMILEGNF